MDITTRAASIDAALRPLWRNRDFVLLWGGQVVSVLGTQISTLALPLLALAVTGSAAQVGLIAAARVLPYPIVSLPAGALIDRWDRKRVMARCDFARLLAYASVPLANALGHLTLAQLYVVALVEGTAFVFFNIAEVACLPRVVHTGQLSQANAFNASGEAVSFLVGPGLGGLIAGLARTTVTGAVVAYAIDAASYLVSVLSLGAIRTPFQGAHPSGGAPLRVEIAQGLRFLWGRPGLRVMALLCMSVNLFFGPMYLATVVLARRDLHVDARALGLILSVASVGGIVGAAIAPWVKARALRAHSHRDDAGAGRGHGDHGRAARAGRGGSARLPAGSRLQRQLGVVPPRADAG